MSSFASPSIVKKRKSLVYMRGFSLMEVLIGTALSSLLIAGIVELLAASTHAYGLQLSQSQLAQSARFAHDTLVSHIAQAGYRPQPWQQQSEISALTADNIDGSALPGDQLGLQRWSQSNCYGNANPVKDSAGQPAFHLLKVNFHINKASNLALNCRYGADNSQLRTQINNFSLVEDIEAMQVLYAEDLDGDGIADHWVTAHRWQQESAVRAIKIGLLLVTKKTFKQVAGEQITLLDQAIDVPADGRLRQVSSFTTAIRGRLR